MNTKSSIISMLTCVMDTTNQLNPKGCALGQGVFLAQGMGRPPGGDGRRGQGGRNRSWWNFAGGDCRGDEGLDGEEAGWELGGVSRRRGGEGGSSTWREAGKEGGRIECRGGMQSSEDGPTRGYRGESLQTEAEHTSCADHGALLDQGGERGEEREQGRNLQSSGDYGQTSSCSGSSSSYSSSSSSSFPSPLPGLRGFGGGGGNACRGASCGEQALAEQGGWQSRGNGNRHPLALYPSRDAKTERIGGGRGGVWRMGGSSLARIVLPILVLGCLISPSGSWIALSKDGYTIKQNLLTEAGLKVEGTMAVNGVLISKPVDYLQCTPERKGAMRWNDKSFEGCDGETDWRPIEMCDRSCNIDTAAVPCGIEVRNKCGDACVKTGTGLNMRQCLLRVISTPCNEQVTDLCSNLCGVQGTFGCASSSERFGSVLIRAAEGTPNATAAFHLSVGQAGAPGQQDEKALFVTYKDRGGVQQDLTVLRRFDEGGEGGASGVDFSPPAGQDAATFRVSMLTEATGPYILVGDDRPEKPSHIFVDGLVDKECPFLFNAGSNDGNYTKICLENPTGMRTLQIPGAGGGSVITSGNREDIGRLGGLEGDNVLIYTGDYRDMSGSGNHTVPMQSRFHCEEDMLATCSVNQTGTCFHTDPSDPAFDLHRVYYVAGGEELPPLTTASVEVLGLLEASRAAGASQLELAQLYMRLVSAEAGLDVQGGEVDAGLEAMLAMNVLGPVTYAERCFVCCCSANNTRDGICPESRERVRPRFCVGGDMDGERCLRDDDCGYEYDGIVNRTYKCLDDSSISCFDTDWGWQCFKAHETANFTTAVNFSNPTMHHSRLEIPDASGTVISTGNLEDITFMGVLDRPIVGKSTNLTTTKLVFDPADLDSPSYIRQQLDAEESVGNSTLLVPSGADGILITTGNLEHVTLDSGMATGVRVSGDVQIDGWIEFGEDEGSSGVRAPPREGSTEYTQPAGGQQPGNAGGGQVPVRGPRGMTVLEVEASAGGSAQARQNVTVLASNGMAISTGNLADVRAEDGAMTSVSVGGVSFLEGGVTVGGSGGSTAESLSFSGDSGEAITYRAEGGQSTTRVNFEVNSGTENLFEIASASGRVVTTGNLEDITAFTGEHLNVSGSTTVLGAVTLGSERSTPITISGHLDGDIVYRGSLNPASDPLRYPVPAPFTGWIRRYMHQCTGSVPAPRSADPLSSFPFYSRYTIPELGSLNGVQHSIATPDQCRAKCFQNNRCGLAVISRYARVRLVSMGGFPQKQSFLAALPRKQRVLNSHLEQDEGCFPGLDMEYVPLNETTQIGGHWVPNFSDVPPYDLSLRPQFRQLWASREGCQAAGAVPAGTAGSAGDPARSQFLTDYWGTRDVWEAFRELEITPSKCGTRHCVDGDGSCRDWNGCTLTIRSHVTGTYLSGSPESACLDYIMPGDVDSTSETESPSCAYWQAQPVTWKASRATPSCLAAGQCAVDPIRVMRFSRDAVCAEVLMKTQKDGEAEKGEAMLTCGPGSVITSVTSVARSSPDSSAGICGAYNASGCEGESWAAGNITEICVEQENCLIAVEGNGGSLRVTATDGTVRTIDAGGCGQDISVEAKCSGTVVLGGPSASIGAQSLMQITLLSSIPVSSDQSSMYLVSSDDQFNKFTLSRDCYTGPLSSASCRSEDSTEWDADVYQKNEETRLSFDDPTGTQTQWFPDVDGTIISSGNSKDIKNLQGLMGQDTFVYTSDWTGLTTRIDFAAIGSSPFGRNSIDVADGMVDDDGFPQHPYPAGGSHRITFPDATGTVITSGNTDDLVFKSVALDGLTVEGPANFGAKGTDPQGNPTMTFFNFGSNTRMTGCINFVNGDDVSEKTQVCAIQPTDGNELTLPDVSGTVVTTGNLLGLPSLRIPTGNLQIGGNSSLEGSVKLGDAADVTTGAWYSWIDSDVGMKLSSAGGGGASVMDISMPKLGGVDLAIRSYLASGADTLAVDVQGHIVHRAPIANTYAINESFCLAYLTNINVRDFSTLTDYLINMNLVLNTRLQGEAYAAVQVDSVQYVLSPPPNSTWGNRTCISGPNSEPGCAFDGSVDTFYSSYVLSTLVGWPPLFVGSNSTNSSNMTEHERQQQIQQQQQLQQQQLLLQQQQLATPVGSRGACVVGLTFESPIIPSYVRINPRPGETNDTAASYALNLVGARLQGTADPDGAAGWQDLYVIGQAPVVGEWSQYSLLPPLAQGRGFRMVRLLASGCGYTGEREGVECRCDLAEVEWHRGWEGANLGGGDGLSVVEDGARSFVVDGERIASGDGESAMVVKCASWRFLPSYVEALGADIVVPEASGVLITTGNLRDITKEGGAISSLGVEGDVQIGGNTVIGENGARSSLEIRSLIDGRYPMTFAGGALDGDLTLGLPDSSVDTIVSFPEAQGRIITTGSLPSVMQDITVVGDTTVKGHVNMEGDVEIGPRLSRSSLGISAPISSAFPLSFRGSSPGNEKLSLGVVDPTQERLVVLPDASGTIITTGNIPDVLESTSFLGEARFIGGASFGSRDVILGPREEGKGKTGLTMHASIRGGTPMRFEGRSVDGRTLSLSIEEPSGANILTLPDVSGTILTTGNFPGVVDEISVVGTTLLEGNAYFGAQSPSAPPSSSPAAGARSGSTEETIIGTADGSSRLEIYSHITGRFPMRFGSRSGASGGGGGTTTLEVTPPTGSNVISFPDASGTVITSGNIPDTVVTPDTYSIIARSIIGKVSSVAAGRGALPSEHEGTFSFSDASSEEPAAPTRPNEFVVRATGGVRLITGGREGSERGVVLLPGAGSWSVLSDESQKVALESVDVSRVAEGLAKRVPISTWKYDLESSGSGADGGNHGDGVRHMGPMAQDLFREYGLGGGDGTTISTVDADGVVMASIQGVGKNQEEMIERAARAEEGAVGARDEAADVAMQFRRLGEQLQDMVAKGRDLKRHVDAYLAARDGVQGGT